MRFQSFVERLITESITSAYCFSEYEIIRSEFEECIYGKDCPDLQKLQFVLSHFVARI